MMANTGETIKSENVFGKTAQREIVARRPNGCIGVGDTSNPNRMGPSIH